MTIKVWDGSAWQMASQIKTWDGSAWQDGANANVHIWTGTAWQKVHPGVNLNSSTSSSAFDLSGPPSAFAQAEVVLFANGTIQTLSSTSASPTSVGVNYSWLLTGANSEYDVYVTNFSGDSLTASAPVDGTRVPLNTTRNFTLYTGYGSSLSASFDLNICSNTGPNTIIQTTSVSLSAEATL
jgi:hypothetical protein